MRRIPAAYDEALDLAGDVLELCKRRRGEKNPDTMAAAISLSNIHWTLGQTDQALAAGRPPRRTTIPPFTVPSTPTTMAAWETSPSCAG